MIVDLVVGARPNYMKAAALYHAWREMKSQLPLFDLRLVSTGQHHAPLMSSALGEELGLPQPAVFLEAAGGSTTKLTATILHRYGELLQTAPPAATVVVGDVTSTMAAALAARQAGIFLIHVEAGLRSHDRSMPEEHNRIVTDALSDLLLVTTEEARQNLLEEGVPENRISVVGNTMIDTLRRQLPHARKPLFWETQNLQENNYLLLTLHRPQNVDVKETFLERIALIAAAAHPLTVVLLQHTRTEDTLAGALLPPNVVLAPPQGHSEFLYLLQNARALLTDSGGASEEAAYLQKRCIVLRANTERPETVVCGSAILVGDNKYLLQKEVQCLHAQTSLALSPVPLWDGLAGKRALKAIAEKLFKEDF